MNDRKERLKDNKPKSPENELKSQKLPKSKDFGKNKDGKDILPRN